MLGRGEGEKEEEKKKKKVFPGRIVSEEDLCLTDTLFHFKTAPLPCQKVIQNNNHNRNPRRFSSLVRIRSLLRPSKKKRGVVWVHEIFTAPADAGYCPDSRSYTGTTRTRGTQLAGRSSTQVFCP